MSTKPGHVYSLPTGPASRWGFIYHSEAESRLPSRAELAPLQAAIKVTDRGLFGVNAFELATDAGTLAACHVCPELGPVRGWGRWPGADHWHVTRDGKTVFRSQNYRAVLRYFLRALARRNQSAKRAV